MTKVLGKILGTVPNIFIVTVCSFFLWGAWMWLKQISPILSMPPTDAAQMGLLVLFLVMAFFWTPLAWLAMYYATPKTLIDRYLREPHFTAAEIIGRSIISPMLPFPTTMFMVACTLPRRWLASRWLQRRQMTDLRDHAPRWFVWCSRIVWTGAVVHGVSWISLFIGLLIYVGLR